MRIFSGIQPTGAKHFGNYSGGFRQYAATQDLGDAFFCIVDLHSITTPQDPEALRESTLDLAAILLATGLEPERSTIFVQSHVSEHAECAWLLGCIATVGELLDPIRLRYGELRANQAVLRAILAEGAAKAELIAAATLEVAYERVGFVAP